MPPPDVSLFPKLKRSYKGRFPFRLSVPSFVYPAGYTENVQRLGPWVDEIELLVFESHPDSLPSRKEVVDLISLARQHGLSYNVHLPIDLELGAADRTRKDHARRLIHTIERVRPLSPTTCTLHLNLDRKEPDEAALRAWQERTVDSIEDILQATALPPQGITIETLDYPPEWFEPIVNQLDLRVCVDVGHVLRYGFDPHDVLKRFRAKIQMIHLHGAADGRDHLALDRLAPHAGRFWQPYLQSFRGTVSLEVFSFDRLETSLTVLESLMTSAPAPATTKPV